MDDASTIINEAARRPRVEVKNPQRGQRDPFRVIEVVELKVPKCTLACRKNHRCYPEGSTLIVHPRQVVAHLKLYPGARVLRHVKRPVARPLRGSGMEPKGHRAPREFLRGKGVHR